MKQLLRQPLLHFLLLGSAVFLLFEYVPAKSGIAPEAKSIVIDREALLNFMQYRSQAFNPQNYSEQLDGMSQADRQQLIDDLVREEVLYREALAMGLNENDYVIKRRLIQKLEFIAQGFITADSRLSEAEINTYYDEHRQDYYVQPNATFTHIFFDYERHTPEQAMMLAEKTLRELNERKISFTQGIEYGDRFLYHANYVERPADYIAAHFGTETAQTIFGLLPDENHWYGPYQSAYGLHLILLTKKEPGYFPEIAKISGWVRDDAEQAMIRERTETAINEIIEGYDIKVALEGVD